MNTAGAAPSPPRPPAGAPIAGGRRFPARPLDAAVILAHLAVAAALLGGLPEGGHAGVPGQDGLNEFRSEGGVLSVTLRAADGKVRIGDIQTDGSTYNGDYAGPVLRVHPGDLLRVRLVNALSEPTNLHFHGMRGSPLGNGDNVHISVAPGDTFTYDIRVPLTQPPGFYWYHAHEHGLSERQVTRGLAGALIVDEPGPRPANAMAERLFVLKDMVFDDDTGDAKIDDDLHGLVQSIDGRIDAARSMRANETQVWRFCNMSANRPFHIALQGHRFRIVAQDGEPIVGARESDVLDIMPAARVDVEVDGGAPGRYDLISKGAMTGTGAARTPDRVLGHLDVTDASTDVTQAAPQANAAPPPDLRGLRVDATRTVVFSQNKTLNEAAQKFYLNGRIFDAGRVDFRVPLGNVEEWTIRNDSDDLHVFHIHQVGFQVTEINGKPMPFTGVVDIVRVPERGEVKVRMAFTDPVILGRFMFHCHVLKHEDRGMMGQIEVYDPRPPRFVERVRLLYAHLWWWMHGVPWSLCGLGYA